VRCAPSHTGGSLSRGAGHSDRWDGWAAFGGAAAQHTHLVIEAHPEAPVLVTVVAHQAHIGVTLHHLAELLHAHLGVVLCSALQSRDLLRLVTNLLSLLEDVAVGFLVPTMWTRDRKVHIKPLGPVALWLAACCYRWGLS
jgi:hypothetical protein